MTSIEEAREHLVRVGVRLGSRGLIAASEGNFSVRLGDDILISPSGKRKDELDPTDLVIVPLDPGRADGIAGPGVPRPSSDIAIHRAIYRARPDVDAVVHAHLPAALALTIVGLRPDPDALPETRLFLPRLPFIPFAQPGSAELAAAIAAAFADRGESGDLDPPGAVLLERHGAIAVGPDPVVAGDRLEFVDLLCRVHRDVILLQATTGGPD
jgi:L-fuculose-phosphate aldolase